MHEVKVCPACEATFECKAGSITICQCMDVVLTPEIREDLSGKYDDCLCIDCLKLAEQKGLIGDASMGFETWH